MKRFDEESIAVVITKIWMENDFDFKEIEIIAENIGPSKFINFVDSIVGRVIIDNSDIVDRFAKYVMDHPDIAMIYAKSGRAKNVDAFKSRICSDVGRWLKKSKWWADNLPEIEDHKKKIKMVKKVMES